MNFLELNLYLSVSREWTSGVSVWSALLAADPQTANATSSIGLLQSLFQAIVLGLVQGVTELLPISSTAHLLVFTKVFGWTTFGEKYFVDSIQFGSVIALLLYF